MATLTSRCGVCGEDVVISGLIYGAQDERIGFVSDDAGTKTAWDHQAKHDEEGT